MGKKNNNKKISVHWSDKVIIPTISIVILFLLLYLLLCEEIIIKYKFQFESYKLILDSIITFASISIGFTGTLLGIILSIEDSRFIKGFKDYPHAKLLAKYIKYNILGGLFIIITSMCLYLKDEITIIVSKNFYCILISMWGASVSFLILNTYKTSSIILKMIFHKDDSHDRKKPKDKIKESKEAEEKIRELIDKNNLNNRES